jgi:hypothetical protein
MNAAGIREIDFGMSFERLKCQCGRDGAIALLLSQKRTFEIGVTAKVSGSR